MKKTAISRFRRFVAGIIRVVALVSAIFALGCPEAWADGNIRGWQCIVVMFGLIFLSAVLMSAAEDVEGV